MMIITWEIMIIMVIELIRAAITISIIIIFLKKFILFIKHHYCLLITNKNE